MKDDHVAHVHERLAACPELCPVGFGEGRRFGLWDLASLAEGAFGECVDPESLTVSSEKRWRLRLGPEGREHRRDGDFRRRYWIRSPGSGSRPLGTIAVDTWPVGVGEVRISSLYVHPVARRQGLASAVLGLVYDACRAEGLYGVRLDTYWTWQPTVRYYLGRRLWVTSWKHALGFARVSYLPQYEVRDGAEGKVTFLVADAEGQLVPLLVAGSDSGRLRLRETEQYRRRRTSMMPYGCMRGRLWRCIWPCAGCRWCAGRRNGPRPTGRVTSVSRRDSPTRSGSSSGLPGRTAGGWRAPLPAAGFCPSTTEKIQMPSPGDSTDDRQVGHSPHEEPP